jgi:transposase
VVRLLEPGAVKRPGGGRPKRRPGRLVGDKAYSRGAIRRALRQHGIRLTMPRTRDERRTGPFDRAIYRLRHQVERLIKRLKQYRRMATRYEKRAENSHTR